MAIAIERRLAIGVNAVALYLDNCRRAVEDFRPLSAICERILPVDGNAGYWRHER